MFDYPYVHSVRLQLGIASEWKHVTHSTVRTNKGVIFLSSGGGKWLLWQHVSLVAYEMF